MSKTNLKKKKEENVKQDLDMKLLNGPLYVRFVL